jgi:hypothetical protein
MAVMACAPPAPLRTYLIPDQLLFRSEIKHGKIVFMFTRALAVPSLVFSLLSKIHPKTTSYTFKTPSVNTNSRAGINCAGDGNYIPKSLSPPLK